MEGDIMENNKIIIKDNKDIASDIMLEGTEYHHAGNRRSNCFQKYVFHMLSSKVFH